MCLCDRIASAITGIPVQRDQQSPRRRADGGSSQRIRPVPSRANTSASVRTVGDRSSQLAIEASTASLPEARPQIRQLAIHGDFRSSPALGRVSQQSGARGSMANLASRPALPGPAASTPAFPLTRTSRPYRSSGGHEAFSLNPSRTPAIGGTDPTPERSSAAAARIANRASRTTAPRSRQKEEEYDLAPLREREILDVTDENIVLLVGTITPSQLPAGPKQSRSQQIARRSNTSMPTIPSQRNDLTARTPSSTPFVNRASGGDDAQPQALYLGVFDLEEQEQSTQQHGSNGRGENTQRGGSSRSSSFGQRSMSGGTSSFVRHTNVTNHGYRIGTPLWRPHSPPPFYPYDYGYDFVPWGYSWGGLPWIDLPWTPRPYIVLPHQTVFAEVSTDYFEQESPASPNLDMYTGLEVINRYYNGWRDAYTLAVSSGDIFAADKGRIQRARDRLQGRQDDAVRRLRSGDHEVVQETLDQVKMDRHMAVDMPATQIWWATPWIREVWVKEHGEIPN